MSTTRPTRPRGGYGGGKDAGGDARRPHGASPAPTPQAPARPTRPGRPGRPGSESVPVPFLDRVRAARRLDRRPVLLAALAAVAVVALLAFAYAGPLLVVRTATVTGPSLPREELVRAAAGIRLGQPLAQVDTRGMSERVSALPFVEHVDVSRSWPSTLRLVVTVRQPAAVVQVPGGGYQVVDATGVPFAASAAPLRGRPVIAVGLAPAQRPALRAALTVIASLPPDVRATVGVVSATTPDDVRFKVGSATVVWGGTDDSDRKAAVFAALRRSEKATVYDLSSPETPVLR